MLKSVDETENGGHSHQAGGGPSPLPGTERQSEGLGRTRRGVRGEEQPGTVHWTPGGVRKTATCKELRMKPKRLSQSLISDSGCHEKMLNITNY